MRHRKSGRRLGRNASHRKAMYRNMATSLLEHGRIRTTDAKAKELRKVVEKLITLSRKVTEADIAAAKGAEQDRLRMKRVHAVRQARRVVKDREILRRLFGEYAEQFKDRPGGYTRITKIGRRPGDNAPMSIIELVEEAYEPKAKKGAPPPVAEAAPVADEPDVVADEPEAAADEPTPDADSTEDGGSMDDLLAETE